MPTKPTILQLLTESLRYNGLKLPNHIGFNLENQILYIQLDQQGCTYNLQSDAASFEAWTICLKHHLPEHIDKVVLNWKTTNIIPTSSQPHYHRFLYRVIRFGEMFEWFEYSPSHEEEIQAFKNQLYGLYINTPLSESTNTNPNSQTEKKIEYDISNLNHIKLFLDLKCINHQLPVGIKNQYGQCFFTGRGSAIDIWGLDQSDNLCIFELKYNNRKTGILSEILFYAEVMYDILISGNIGKPRNHKPIRDADKIYDKKATPIQSIKAYLLTDRLHPLVSGTTALLNTNRNGIKFFTLEYRLSRNSTRFDILYFKGGYQLQEELRQVDHRKKTNLLGHSYLLEKGEDNLYEPIRKDVLQYFSDNGISWWTFTKNDIEPTKHMVSSQIQCLNYLFPLRNNHNAVLQLAQLFDSEITDVLPTLNDKDTGFIAFEFIFKNDSLLNETNHGWQRGKLCTSVDAFIIALKDNQKVLIPIEWKYSESYLRYDNKALEPIKGTSRQNRYNTLIYQSNQLISTDNLSQSIYYHEPFYELMRQTLLVEQMVRENLANDYLHILITPERNRDLLDANYPISSLALKETWRSHLKGQKRFKQVDSLKILELIEEMDEFSDQACYLKTRYQ